MELLFPDVHILKPDIYKQDPAACNRPIQGKADPYGRLTAHQAENLSSRGRQYFLQRNYDFLKKAFF